jgi:hypothetical protein
MKSTPARKARFKRWVLRLGLAAAALIGIAAAVVTVLALRSHNNEVALDPDLVAVATLTNETGDATLAPLGRMAAEWITQGIQQHGVAEVVPPSVALAAATEAQEASDRVAAFAQATGAGVVLHGAYYVLGDSLQFQIQISDAVEGRLMSALEPVTGPSEPASEALDLLPERVLGPLAAALDFRSGRLNFPMQPRSLEAYRVFRQGFDAVIRGDQEEGLRLYRAAWAMDSTLYPVLVLIAVMQGTDSLFRLAEGYRDRMKEPERLFLQLNQAREPEAYLRPARRLAELAPVWTLWAGWGAWQAYRPREALEHFARVDTANPYRLARPYRVSRWIAWAHHIASGPMIYC